jgi:hypothetical protein
MTIVRGIQKLASINPRGRFGTRKGVPRDGTHWAHIHRNNPWAGIYQRKVTKRGKETSRMKFYYPTNPRTKKQQAWRAVFRAGKAAWDSLTEIQKESYNRRAIRLKFTGYNLFQREYLRTHKLVL